MDDLSIPSCKRENLMKLWLLIPLLVTLALPSILLAELPYAGVVRIHFDESVVPDLSVIHDTYTGPGPTVCAHIVIDSLPDGVSGYALGYEFVSEDSSVVVLPGFHPSPGWRILGPQEDLTMTTGARVAQTPVSVGYWRLWLKGGRVSRGYVRLQAIAAEGACDLILHVAGGSDVAAARAYNGAIHELPPSTTDLSDVPEIALDDWSAMPEVESSWVMQVAADSCHLLRNRFAETQRESPEHREFPIEFVQVTKTFSSDLPDGRIQGGAPTTYVAVRPDGVVGNPMIQWEPAHRATGVGEEVGSSITGEVALFARNGATKMVRGDGTTLAEIGETVKWALCFDMAGRIAAIGRQDVALGNRIRELNRLSLLDFNGRIVFQGEWTECSISTVGMGRNPDVVKFSLDGCADAGDYLTRVSEGTTYSLRGLPRKGRCFSPDSRSILINRQGVLSYFDAEDPEGPRLSWTRRVRGNISAVAVSDGRNFVAFRVGPEDQDGSQIYVLSASDGTPICKLHEDPGWPAPGPMGFLGDFLFVGMDFSLRGTAWNTRCIYVFNLGALAR